MNEPSTNTTVTFERFIELAARGSVLVRVRYMMLTLLAVVMPFARLQSRLLAQRKDDQTRLRYLGDMKALFAAMRPAERDDPSLINHARRKELAEALGIDPLTISNVKRQFFSLRRAMQQLLDAPQPRSLDEHKT